MVTIPILKPLDIILVIAAAIVVTVVVIAIVIIATVLTVTTVVVIAIAIAAIATIIIAVAVIPGLQWWTCCHLIWYGHTHLKGLVCLGLHACCHLALYLLNRK